MPSKLFCSVRKKEKKKEKKKRKERKGEGWERRPLHIDPRN
jgi:hypothetical protein